MRVANLVDEHFNLIELRPVYANWFVLDPRLREKSKALAAVGSGGTLVHDGRIIGIIGYIEVVLGVFEVWAYPSIYIDGCKLIYLRTCKRYIKAIEEHLKPHRLQTTSIADDLHDNWMRFLGFECEGTLKSYFVDKADAHLWSKTY